MLIYAGCGAGLVAVAGVSFWVLNGAEKAGRKRALQQRYQ